MNNNVQQAQKKFNSGHNLGLKGKIHCFKNFLLGTGKMLLKSACYAQVKEIKKQKQALTPR